jgi:hypothetical protein
MRSFLCPGHACLSWTALVLSGRIENGGLRLRAMVTRMSCYLRFAHIQHELNTHSFPPSVDQLSTLHHHQHRHPMDRFGRRAQESGSHPQDRRYSGSQSQQTLPPFRDVVCSLSTQSGVMLRVH